MTNAQLPGVDLATVRTWLGIASDAMIAVDGAGRVVLANARAGRMFGYLPRTLQGMEVETLMPGSLRRMLDAGARARTRRRGTRPQAVGHELVGRKRGRQAFAVELDLAAVSSASGTLVIAAVHDLSASRQTQQALARTRRENHLALISRLALEAPDTRFGIRRMLELTAAAMEASSAALLAGHGRPGLLQIEATTGLSATGIRALASALSHRVPSTPRAPTRRPSALRKQLAAAHLDVAAMVPLHGKQEVFGFLLLLGAPGKRLDASQTRFLQAAANLLTAAMQRNRIEERLAHAQRLEAVGQLTGGVAHDFNNLLTVISGNLQLLEAELTDRPALQEVLDSALSAVDRGADLTRRLLAFARRQPLCPRAVVPQPLLQEVATMLRRTLGEAIEVKIDCAASVPDVLADSSGLETALINLALNARDAMPRGGRLEMAAHVVALEGNNFWKLPEAPYVVISVTDTGSGMPPEVMARAPEPFFTTKAAGKGSGLGLSMVYGFALQSGGAIDMASQPGFGTRVEIMLPVATPPGTTPPHERKAAPRREARGSATILVVEDESDVRAVAARFLTAIGYRVIAADGPQEALQRLRSDTAIDLLFSDVVLGSATDGVELAREARQIRPDLPVLLTSGYPGAGRRRRVYSQTPEFAMLRKPYRREQLVSALEDLLGHA